MDTLGLLWGCHITTANISDKRGMRECMDKFYLLCVQKLWVDQRYEGYPFESMCADRGIIVEVVKRAEEGFKVLKKRWIVERTFSWMNRYRRVSKDYESLLEISQNWCYMAMIRLMIKRVGIANFRFYGTVNKATQRSS